MGFVSVTITKRRLKCGLCLGKDPLSSAKSSITVINEGTGMRQHSRGRARGMGNENAIWDLPVSVL